MSHPTSHSPLAGAAIPRTPVFALGGACTLLGLMVLLGWYLHLDAIVQIPPTLPPMQYNTALCFVAAGMALCVRAWGKAWLPVAVLGGLVAAVGGLTLGEYLFQCNLGIDQVLFKSYIMTQTSQAGRMAPISALCFTLVGASLVLLGRKAPVWGRPLAVGSLGSIVMSISVVSLSGYFFGLPGTYGWGELTRVAMHTAVGLGLLGGGLFIVAWHLAVRAGERSPRWLPVPLTLGILTGSLVLYFALDARQNEDIAQAARSGAEGAKNQIELRMEARIRSLGRMAHRWEFSGAPARGVWEDDAANYLHDFPDMQAIEWMDSGHFVRWIVPLAGNEGKLNRDLAREERRKAAVTEADRERQPVITRIVTLFRGGLGFVVYVPIIVHGQSGGYIVAVFNAQLCLSRYLPPALAPGSAITVSEGGQQFFERDASAPPMREDWLAAEKIQLHGATWDLRLWPTPALAARLNSPLPAVVLCAGMLGALLLGAVCYYAQRSSRQAIETTLANAALQAALDTVRTLEGLLPICSSCKRVRDDTGYWSQIDTYLCQHTNASLSHGYCPECAAKAFKEFGMEVPDDVQAAVAAGNFE